MHAEQNVSVATAAPSVNETNDQRKSATQNVLLLGRLAAAIHGPGVPPPKRSTPPPPNGYVFALLYCQDTRVSNALHAHMHRDAQTHHRTDKIMKDYA